MTHFVFNDGGRLAAGYKGNSGDCVCRSIAIITGKPYQEVYDVLAKGNASQRIGKGQRKRPLSASKGICTKRKWFEDYVKSIGLEWVPTMFIGQGCKVHLIETELPMGRLMVNVSGHFTSVIDGVLHDTYDCSRGGKRCVYGYYKFVNN